MKELNPNPLSRSKCQRGKKEKGGVSEHRREWREKGKKGDPRGLSVVSKERKKRETVRRPVPPRKRKGGGDPGRPFLLIIGKRKKRGEGGESDGNGN